MKAVATNEPQREVIPPEQPIGSLSLTESILKEHKSFISKLLESKVRFIALSDGKVTGHHAPSGAPVLALY